MYQQYIFDLHELERRFRYDEGTVNLLKSVHNALINDYPKEEIIEALFDVLKGMKGYREGWNDAVDEYQLYDYIEHL